MFWQPKSPINVMEALCPAPPTQSKKREDQFINNNEISVPSVNHGILWKYKLTDCD